MKTYYIYLVIIWHPKYTLYYVGKHSWFGSGKDPLYEGSCTYRFYKKWLSDYAHNVRVLEYTTQETTDEREGYWIKRCLSKHGSFLFGTNTPAGTKRSWLDEFGKGYCLNGHWGHSDLAKAMLTPEAISASHRTHVETGQQTKFMVHSAASSKEAQLKSLCSRIENGSLHRAQKLATVAAHTEEAKLKRLVTLKNNARKCKVVAPDGDIFVGCQSEVSEFLCEKCGQVVKFHRLNEILNGKLKSPWSPRWGILKGFTFEQCIKS